MPIHPDCSIDQHLPGLDLLPFRSRVRNQVLCLVDLARHWDLQKVVAKFKVTTRPTSEQ